VARRPSGAVPSRRQSLSQLDLKPDRNSSFYRGDSFPPARAKQTATLAGTRSASTTLAPLAPILCARSTRIYVFRARKRNVYYRACPAISVLSSRLCFVLLSESTDDGTRSLVLGCLNRSSVHDVSASLSSKNTLINYASALSHSVSR